MWLLDKNVPIQLKELLSDLGIQALTADSKGWGTRTNGQLLAAAIGAGISCILTRDRLFARSVSKALTTNSRISIVIVTLPQLRAPAFLDAFQRAWSIAPIQPVSGEPVVWPRSA